MAKPVLVTGVAGASIHRVIAGCETMYFGMSVSDTYLAATVNAAAVVPAGSELVQFHPADGQSS